MSKARAWALVTMRLPAMPAHRTVRQLKKLTKRELAERCWAATVNQDFSMQSASEAMARSAELVEMVEGRRPVDADLLRRLNEHKAHVVKCRAGSCEHEYAALVRADVILDTFGEEQK